MSTDASIVVGSPGPNTDAISGKIQAFVDQYNSTVDFLDSKINEKKVVNPTTDDDRAKGVLNADPALQGILVTAARASGDTFTGSAPGTGPARPRRRVDGQDVGAGTINQDAIDGRLDARHRPSSQVLADRFSEVK